MLLYRWNKRIGPDTDRGKRAIEQNREKLNRYKNKRRKTKEN